MISAPVLSWKSHPHMDSTLIALGVRSIYMVSRLGSWWWLEARSHDQLQRHGTATSGPFLTALDARREAQRIDSTILASQTSGAHGRGCRMVNAVPSLGTHIP